LLIPIFLVYVGTELNPAAVVDPATMLVALAFLAALVIGKLLAAAAAGGLLRFSLAETGVMFGMSLPQAAATLAATIVGARLGLFSSQIVSSVVLVVLVSLLVGSLATRMAAARVSVAEGRETALGRRVLCAVRDTATAERLAHLAALVAARDCGTVVPVVFSLAPAKVGEREHDLLQLAETAATAAGNDVAGRVRSANSFVSGVRSATAEESPSSVVLGWQKSSALDMQFLGTELDRVGRLIDEPLLAARFDTEIVERVLVFLDARPRSGSRIPSALIALDVAERIADGTGCPLEIVSTRRTDVDHLVESLDVHDFKHRVIDGGPIAANLGFARGDLLVMTPASYRGWLGRASLDAVDGLSLLIAAEAGAMRVSNAGTSREVVLGWERPT
ncbi:MAG: cation:proton antiporter, partial [Coriobacteriia bacterium]|nr:cation:proton antiporter [Coriobacteriia bacterium]